MCTRAATTMDEHTVNRGAPPPYPVIFCCCPHELEELGDGSHGGHVMKTSMECDLQCDQQQEDVLGPDRPLKMANGGRMLPRSPSRDKDFATCVRTNAAVAAITAQQQQLQQQQQPFATTAVVLNRVSNSFPEAFFKRYYYTYTMRSRLFALILLYARILYASRISIFALLRRLLARSL